MILILMRSVTAANIMTLNPALYTLEQDIMIRVLVGLFRETLIQVKTMIHLV